MNEILQVIPQSRLSVSTIGSCPSVGHVGQDRDCRERGAPMQLGLLRTLHVHLVLSSTQLTHRQFILGMPRCSQQYLSVYRQPASSIPIFRNKLFYLPCAYPATWPRTLRIGRV
jgi:hypothetical protein